MKEKYIKQMSSTAELIETIRKYALVALSKARYAHSMRVATMSETLCQKFGINPELGRLCGVAHDMCKELSDDLLISFASRDGMPIKDIEKNKPSLLHGRAAAVKLNEDYAVTNRDVLQAIANHTFGCKGLYDLGKILYVADKIEPGREHITKEYLDNIMKMDLNSMTAFVVQENVDFLNARGKAIADDTLELLESLKK